MNLQNELSRRSFAKSLVAAFAVTATASVPAFNRVSATSNLMHDDRYVNPLDDTHPAKGTTAGQGRLMLGLFKMPEGQPAIINPNARTTEMISADTSMKVIFSDGSEHSFEEFERGQHGHYIIDAPVGSLEITNAEPVSTDHGITNGYVQANSIFWEIPDQLMIFGEVVYGYGAPSGGATTDTSAPSASGKPIEHDPALPPLEREETQLSMGGPEGLGRLRLYLMVMQNPVRPTLDGDYKVVAGDGIETITDANGALHNLLDFPQEADGAYMIEIPAGMAELRGFEPVNTDLATTNGTVASDENGHQVVTMQMYPGNTVTGYIIYGAV